MQAGDKFLLKYKNKKGEKKRDVLMFIKKTRPEGKYRFTVMQNWKYLDLSLEDIKKIIPYERDIFINDTEKKSIKPKDILTPAPRTSFYDFQKIGLTTAEYYVLCRKGAKVKEVRGFNFVINIIKRQITVSQYKLQRLFTVKK